ncbi:MAG: hypothetical protein ACRC7O_17175 [Fimbriiglobus sp.]
MTPEVPTADELHAHPVVQAAFVVAWADSFPDDPTLRHEEGGWVYMHEQTGRLLIRRSLPGRKRAIDLTAPPVIPDHFLIAIFHTHPNPTDDGWNPEPSSDDRRFAMARGVPNLILSDIGPFSAGPSRRVGGLSGPRGYPS